MKCASFGTGTKNFIILPGLSVHSVVSSVGAIAETYSMFADDYRVYIIESPDNLPDNVTLQDLAEETASTIRLLGIEKADILGVSMGGMIAIQVAANHPELAGRMILGSTLAESDDGFRSVMKKWISLAQNKNETKLLESFADYVYSENTLNRFRDMIISSGLGITDDEYQRFIALAGAAGKADFAGILKKIQCQVLIIGADGDKVVSPECISQLRDIPGSKMYMYGNEFGHGVYDEAPDYKHRCYEFLRR